MGLAKQINALNKPAPCHVGLLCLWITSVHFNHKDNRLNTNNVIDMSVSAEEMRSANVMNFVTIVIIIQIGMVDFSVSMNTGVYLNCN